MLWYAQKHCVLLPKFSLTTSSSKYRFQIVGVRSNVVKMVYSKSSINVQAAAVDNSVTVQIAVFWTSDNAQIYKASLVLILYCDPISVGPPSGLNVYVPCYTRCNGVTNHHFWVIYGNTFCLIALCQSHQSRICLILELIHAAFYLLGFPGFLTLLIKIIMKLICSIWLKKMVNSRVQILSENVVAYGD